METKLGSLIFGSFSIGIIEALQNIPLTELSEIIKLLIQLGVGIATIITMLRKNKSLNDKSK